MSPITPSSLYQSALSEGQYQPDEVQCNTVARLDIIHHDLGNRSPEQALPSSGLKSLLGRLFGGLSTEQPRPVQGLYMWGGVGRGKTWLMDMFFQSLPTDRKLRLHFHRFMLRVHEELTALQGHENPLDVIADGFKAQTDVLCFDEFFVSDITDAMILGTLLEALFKRGIALVATSNIPPDELYRNGLQRARFLPAIEQIKKYCDVMNVDAGIDYRLRTLTQAHLYLTPLSEDNRQEMHRIFQRLAGREGEPNPVLEINHRSMPAISSVDGVLAINFKTLCEDPRSPLDYIALSKLYHSVLLHDTPAMTALDESAARRFLALVDEFYERHVKLIINAETPMERIYQGELLTFEYRRCLSRLQEMQSEEYLKLPHLP
ncbi:AFG1 family ATPase [Xenorhabdus bovienii]|uniref:cell division protein ZapE n=1 Tax=Xenorhabdus bovienii TaxID=40576 RepID=UPI0023B279B9|nr:cell division protein ZapE [Xenorhabdus bovienii]MDE9492323.1 AFG1 family ATPase [Xenorhabdus bovienii]MDE9500847.1 AFG1 family ATPase [Xenorhabdus bovienii]MDE9516655.1 AFG1 family ATPase [Xenorhabdus bovienii]MDE9525003.1 AFG1 family ATPase [Xenorhabdus bovienii]MDE9567713.1 AFG1 family ATPase [Xenorhabdus bovienii]